MNARRRTLVLAAVCLLAPLFPSAPAAAQSDAAIVYSAYRYGGKGSGAAIFTIVPGGERVRLTGSRSFNLEPVWSPDRTRIAYVHSAKPRNPDIWVMDADGTNKVRLTTGPRDDVYPQWSPDGTHIAWVKARAGAGTGRIYVMHPDGSDKMPVSPESHRAVLPAWSPDGHSIAYVDDEPCTECEADAEIYVVDGHSTGEATRVTDNAVHDVGPVWSPDGSRIAFARTRDDGGDIYSIAPDGSDERRLTSLTGFAFLPRWSPDGSQIAFTVVVDEDNFHTRLGIVSSDGGDDRFLTDVATGGIQPDWSPDGDRIAFLGFHSGGYNLGVISPDGTGATQVTSSRVDEAWLDW
jgi:TolB protein